MSFLKEFQEKDFNEFIKLKKSGLVLFSAPWCAACKIVSPLIEKFAQINNQLLFIKIDVSKFPGVASRMGVMSLPNILIFDKGKIVEQIIGSTIQKDIEKKLAKIL